MSGTLRIGIVGYKFMGKAHGNAYLQVPRFFPLKTKLALRC